MKLARSSVAGAGMVERRAIFLHGMLGTGANWRTIARRFVTARRGWDAWLIDLRGHGASPKGQPGPSLAAVARDLVETMEPSDVQVDLVAGHSFGGKVALEALRQGAAPAHVLTIDSPPGRREVERGGDSALAVIEMLRRLPASFPSRAAFVDAVEATGHSPTLSGWLAMSTEGHEGGVRFALDLGELEALLVDYFKTDLWPVVEAPPEGVAIHFVIGERSDAWSAEERARATRAPGATVDALPAGHWVHTEDPEGLVRVMIDRINP